MLIGYARVSTQDQNLDAQIKALKDAGCEKIYSEKISTRQADRPVLQQLLEFLRKDDTLIVWKLDRLGRSLKHLTAFMAQLDEKEVQFHSLTDHINTGSPAGRFFFHVMASLAQMERELIVERTNAGLAAARLKGRKGGRPRAMTPSKLRTAKRLKTMGIPVPEISKSIEVNLSTVYRWLKDV